MQSSGGGAHGIDFCKFFGRFYSLDQERIEIELFKGQSFFLSCSNSGSSSARGTGNDPNAMFDFD